MKKLVAENLIEFLNEDMGGVSAPMSTLTNTPGMGDVSTPVNNSNIGSGDNWGTISKPAKKKSNIKVSVKTKKKKRKTKIKEDQINPHDKIGVMMAKKMKVPVYFKKKGQGVKQKTK